MTDSDLTGLKLTPASVVPEALLQRVERKVCFQCVRMLLHQHMRNKSPLTDVYLSCSTAVLHI